jgi:hypothetical protein
MSDAVLCAVCDQETIAPFSCWPCGALLCFRCFDEHGQCITCLQRALASDETDR